MQIKWKWMVSVEEWITFLFQGATLTGNIKFACKRTHTDTITNLRPNIYSFYFIQQVSWNCKSFPLYCLWTYYMLAHFIFFSIDTRAYHMQSDMQQWEDNRIRVQTSCLAILSLETMRKPLASGNLKHHLFKDATQTWHSPHSPPAPFKPRVSGHVSLSANFFRRCGSTLFLKKQTLTALSKKVSLAGWVSYRKTTSWRRIREWRTLTGTVTTAFLFPLPQVCVSPLMMMCHTVWPPCLPPWLTKSLKPAD